MPDVVLANVPMTQGKLTADVAVLMSQQCLTCKRLGPGLSCKAFITGIPELVLSGQHDHREAFPGDGGKRYDPI